MKQISKIFITILIVVTSINPGIANNQKESFEKLYKLKSTGKFTFSCYDTDLKINTWKNDEVKLLGEIIIEGGNKEDQEQLIQVFKNPEVSQSSNSLKIETDMATKTVSIGFLKKITLVNGKSIKIDNYKVKYTLWIPESVAFNLRSKYNTIEIAALKGNINFNLYDVNLTLVSFGTGVFDMKYSSVDIEKGKTAKFDVYNCKINVNDIITFSANSKYSEFNINNVESISTTSYNDKFRMKNLTKLLIGQAKYSYFENEGNFEELKIDVYNSDIKAKNINKITYSAKYSNLQAQDVNTLEVSDIYNTDIKLGAVESFSCDESKYDNIRFTSIGKSINMGNVYTSKLNFGTTGPKFENFSGEFKYGSVNLKLDENIDFKISYKTTYGSVKFPIERIKIKESDIIENNNHLYEGSTSENTKCKFEFNAYSTAFNFTNSINNKVKQKEENNKVERPARPKRPARTERTDRVTK